MTETHTLVTFSLDEVVLGTSIQSFVIAIEDFPSLRILRPFSWDAKHRAFEVVEIELSKPVVVVSGPYATADVQAWNVDPNHDVGFPESAEHDGVLYTVAGEPATIASRYQDAAGWFTIAGRSEADENIFVGFALERSNTQLVVIERLAKELKVNLVLPKQVYPIEAVPRMKDLPKMQVVTGSGVHEDGEKQLRGLISQAMPARARNYLSPLIVDTWGFGTKVDEELVTAVAKTAKELELEILTVDKGWETTVGDWLPGPHFPSGLPGLSELTKSNGTRLGLWAALGNADPKSKVAQLHPEWIASWRGKKQVVSHRTNSLCLGHEPVIEYLLGCLGELAECGLTWLLHDFETISRCDSDQHTHDPSLGEDAGVRGWYNLLSRFRAKYPNVWIENCWNGARPLDLQMVAHHDTTIGDDWCDVRHNAVAKVGLGRYLPAHWCSAYAQDQNSLPLRSQLAIYSVGGPWILMGDIPNWSKEKLELCKKVMACYRRWRILFPEGRVDWTEISAWKSGEGWRADQDLLAISFLHDSGKELMAAVVVNPIDGEVRWHPRHKSAVKVTDEFTGETFNYSVDEVKAGIVMPTSRPEGFLFSVQPN